MLLAALERTVAGHGRLLLAISGGLDSMALLRAAALWPGAGGRLVVATFDHGTGEASREAVRLVREEAGRLGVPVVVGRAGVPARDEAGWRRDRWAFLAGEAMALGATVVTAHTRDDQVETVLQRLMRGAGPRGLAALLAPSPVRRPWLGVSRAALAAWVRVAGIPFVTDPSNTSRRHQRNRLRLDILPALRRQWPTVDGYLLEVGRRAAAWRRDVERVVDDLRPVADVEGGVSVAREALDGCSPGELAVVWPALAARAGVRLDRRGTRRAVEFTTSAGRVARMPLAGEAEVVALPRRFVIRPRGTVLDREVALVGEVDAGPFRFRPETGGPGEGMRAAAGDDPWRAVLPMGVPLTVRPWRPGDRIRAAGGVAATERRVKRYLAEAGIPGPLREGWPVVVAAGEIIWIPGVCRTVAATARPGRPEALYRCDRIVR